MKKTIILIVVILIAGLLIWKFSGSGLVSTDNSNSNASTSVPTSQTVVVTNKLSEYKNDELGFSVKYPTAWERSESSTNVKFTIPTYVKDSADKNTVSTLESKIDVFSGKCAFPPVSSVKERDTLTVDGLTFNMISIANTVQSRHFFDRMYSLQKDSICYFFTFSSLTTTPASKGLVGQDAQKAGANNTKLVDAADSQFKDMVKSFKFVIGPAGQDETKASPKK